MNKEPNKSEPNEEAKVLSDEELEGIVGGGVETVKKFEDVGMRIRKELPALHDE